MNTINYLQEIYLIEELNLIQEGFGEFVKQQVGNKGKQLFEKLKKVKDIVSFKKLTNHVPKLGPQKINEVAKKHVANFAKNKRLAARELKNVPDNIKAPMCSMVAIASKDDNHLKKMAKQISRQVIDWDQANTNLLLNIIISAIIAGLFAAVGTTPFGLYMGLFLIIDLVLYIFDIAFIARKEVSA